MKYSKRYIAFTFILALIFVSNFYIYAKDSSTLGAFRGAQIDNTIWSPLVAADVKGMESNGGKGSQRADHSCRNR